MLINIKALPIDPPTPPEYLKEWCLHPGSLTDKLRLHTGSVELQILSQSWGKRDWWAQYFLAVQDGLIYQREILMTHQNTNYWYAKTLIPEACYNSAPELFSRLKNESMRNLIFDTKEVKRAQMIHYPINAQCLESQWLSKHSLSPKKIVWVRLAQYTLDYLSFFYVVELLLPELENLK